MSVFLWKLVYNMDFVLLKENGIFYFKFCVKLN